MKWNDLTSLPDIEQVVLVFTEITVETDYTILPIEDKKIFDITVGVLDRSFGWKLGCFENFKPINPEHNLKVKFWSELKNIPIEINKIEK